MTSPAPDIPPRFRGVLLDWRGTLVVGPSPRSLVVRALHVTGRDASPDAVAGVLEQLAQADDTAVASSAIDTDAALHRSAYLAWFREAGLDDELAAALYAAESDVLDNPFAHDVGPLLEALADAGVRVAVVSDIHVDIRPAFAAHARPDGGTWADLVDCWVLSSELGVAKPDPEIFRAALAGLALAAAEVLMVGDRGAWDGAAADLGITTLLVPPLRSAEDTRLQRVIDLVLPGASLSRSPRGRTTGPIERTDPSGVR
ncbi:HAD family hydrolase [Cellulomonas sp. P22]|uniref:HAD family hydrolase n=1 Tax=Cellulomonas sp. P22 TaxID=3373189 RepID=UPI0037AB0214